MKLNQEKKELIKKEAHHEGRKGVQLGIKNNKYQILCFLSRL